MTTKHDRAVIRTVDKIASKASPRWFIDVPRGRDPDENGKGPWTYILGTLGIVTLWLFGIAALASSVLATAWEGLIPVLEQVATWALLGVVMATGAIFAAFGWMLQVLAPRVVLTGYEREGIPPDLKDLSREQRFDVMAQWNARFYARELSVFIPLQRPIRLIYIEPGQYQDPLVCQTVTTTLSSGVEYVALSYAWGDWDGKSQSLKLDEQEGFRLTWNAYNALRRIRGCNERRLIWIDAICIDQSNPREKSGQIRLMGAIYQRAKRVYVYLGPCQDTENHGRDMSDEDVIKCTQHSLLSLKDGGKSWLQEPPSSSLWWWRRSWTVQETIVPLEITILLGPHFYTWTELCQIAHYRGPLPTQMAHSILQVDQLRTVWHNRHHELGLPLSDLLAHTATREATQAVDRVFSILAMKSETTEGVADLIADYGMSLRTLDLETTTYIVRNEQNLNIFLYGWHRQRDLTWVVRFTAPPSPHGSPVDACRELLRGREPAAGAGTSFPREIRDGRLQLGYSSVFDEIVYVYDDIPPSFAHLADEVLWSQKLAENFYRAACDQVDSASMEITDRRAGLVSLAFVAGSKYDLAGKRSSNGHGQSWNTAQRFERAKTAQKYLHRHGWRRQKENGATAEFVQYARHCSKLGRSFFVTRLGFVGIAYPPERHFKVEDGQIIVVTPGTHMPLLLQPLRSHSHGSERPYHFIAPVYVSCLMAGELDEFGLWRRESFVIA